MVTDKVSLVKQIGEKSYEQLFDLISQLRRRQVMGSYIVAKRTGEFFRFMISTSKWKTAKEAIRVIHLIGDLLTNAQPIELCVGNITRRVLFFIRDAANHAVSDKETLSAVGLQDILIRQDQRHEGLEAEFRGLKGIVLEEINNFLEELDGIHSSISNQALDHIHSREIIMTYGRSTSVIQFFIEAGRKRTFDVIVPESAPRFKGKETAAKLSEAGIETTLIAESAIFAMMSRVNKVIVGTNAVLANGGLLAESGVRMIAEAAKHYSVPFVVCCGMYKLSPVYPSGRDLFNVMNSPGELISFEELDTICKNNSHGVDVLNPALDYVPPEIVSLYLTNFGVHSPSYIYRVLSEYYCLEDYTFISKSDPEEELRKIIEKKSSFSSLRDFLRVNHSFNVNQTILPDKMNLLELFVEKNDIDSVKLLLQHPSIDVNNGIPLEIACENEYGEIAKMILEHPKIKMEYDSLGEYHQFIESLK